jgi:surfactin synthase thioesterase subunit
MQVDEINAWQDETTGSFETALLPGGHFFITSHEQDLLAVLARQLSRAMVRS